MLSTKKGGTNIIFLSIDFINDFKYADLVEVGGIIIFHDTNIHPGPSVLVDALDPNYYKVKRHCTNDKADWGIAVAQKIK